MSFPSADLFTLALFLWVVSEAWIILRDWGKLDWSQDRYTQLSILLSFLLALLVAGYISPLPYFRIATPQQYHVIVGVLLMFAGIALRIWSVVTLGKFFRTTVMILPGHRVITTGPYHLIRHPSYTGMLLTVLGASLAFGSWLGVVLMVAAVFVGLSHRIVVEERVLKSSLGQEYEEYMRRTKKLIPFLY
jgi:protein-S-isoprenylcysteine O-methyltransferase